MECWRSSPAALSRTPATRANILDISYLNASVDPDPNNVTERVNPVSVECAQLLSYGRQSSFRAQRVTVTHRPQIV